ncbi:MAG: DivIVA domain-containing protein [Ignavibacteriaceae bacterium]|nr:DivIVA domain-containing protein [Ignavibacteriaceae bacterium]
MIFTPDGIRKQEFNKSFRGYNRDEVHAFLEKLSTEFEALLCEFDDTKKELNELKQRLEKFIQLENQIQQTIIGSKQKSSQLIDEAQKKAGEILRLAEEKSSELLQKSHEEANSLKTAINNLKEEKEILIAKLKTIINYQSHLLEMKVEEAGEEIRDEKKPEHSSGVDVNVDDIVQKLL